MEDAIYITKENEQRIFRPADIFLCPTCTEGGKYPDGKPFSPATDLDAEGRGLSWTCGECVRAEREQKTIRDLFKMNKN
jgi:hypothetical protein